MLQRIAKYKVSYSRNDHTLGLMSECPVCGKDFYMPEVSSYAYKRRIGDRYVNVCSYKCARQLDSILDHYKFSRGGKYKEKRKVKGEEWNLYA